MSQLVYSLNREFPEQLVVKERQRHYLNRTISTDYGAFVAAISQNRLMEAAELLRRGLLSELTRSPSDAFSEWLDDTRIELRARVRQAAAEQWTRLTGQGRWKRAIEPARALLSLNAYDERALRKLIRAEAMTGSVREAEAAFHSFVERSELGNRDWVPQAETLSLVDHLRDMPPQATIRVAVRGLDRPPLIGRSEDLAALSTAMLPAPGEGLRLVVIRGERGTGKTRLAEESLAVHSLNGIRAIRCPALKTGRRFFLHALLDALASCDFGAGLRDLAQPWRTIVLELLTERQAGTRPPSEPPEVESDPIRRRYFEAIRQLLVLVAGTAPTILFVDDFHCVEEDSAAVLRYLVQRWSSTPLVIALSVETGSVRGKDPVNRLFGDSLLQREPSEFFLGELTREAAAGLVDTVAGSRFEEEERDRIVELSGRNPLFLLKLVERSLKGRRLPSLDPDDFVPAPQSISDIFSGRLAELDDDAERTLQLLSVMGRPLSVARVSTLTDRSRDSCVNALDELQRCRLISRVPRGFAVRHELIRNTVYDRMRATRRAWAHGLVARHLDDVKATAAPAEVALHYHHAGMPAKALRHALSGASAAEKSGAFAEASRLFALARQNIHDPRIHARMAQRLARLHYVRREIVDGPSRLAEAASLLRKVQHFQSALVAEVQRVDLLASCGSCSPREAVANIRDLRRTAEQARHWKAVVTAIDIELRLHVREGQALEADTLAAHAGRLLDQVEPASRGSLHASLALHHQGNLGEGIGHAREAIALARRKRAPDELLRALGRLVAIQGARGRPTDPEAVSAVEEGETLARDRDDFVEHYELLAGAGTGYRAVGRLDQARNWFAKAGEVLAKVNTCQSHVSLECKLGELALEARELEQAAKHFNRAREHWKPGMGRYLGIISHSGAGLIALRLGQLSRARRMADHISEPPASWFDDPWVFALFKAHLCEWRGVVGEGVDSVSDIAKEIETSQPAHWARLKSEEALLRLRHSLPRRHEVAETAVEAAADLGIDRWVRLLNAARRRAH